MERNDSIDLVKGITSKNTNRKEAQEEAPSASGTGPSTTFPTMLYRFLCEINDSLCSAIRLKHPTQKKGHTKRTSTNHSEPPLPYHPILYNLQQHPLVSNSTKQDLVNRLFLQRRYRISLVRKRHLCGTRQRQFLMHIIYIAQLMDRKNKIK